MGDGEELSDSTPSLDERLRMLSNASRRQLLGELLDTPAVRETDLPRVIGDDDAELKIVVVKMYHHHLPLLVENGLVDWSSEDGVVRRGPAFESVRPMLEWLGAHEEGSGTES
jgi:hypothetical protein